MRLSSDQLSTVGIACMCISVVIGIGFVVWLVNDNIVAVNAGALSILVGFRDLLRFLIFGEPFGLKLAFWGMLFGSVGFILLHVSGRVKTSEEEEATE